MERVDTDPYPSFKFYMKKQIFDSYQKECIIINYPVCRRLKCNDLLHSSWMILNGVTQL